jgi:glycosyltransferase involved in cell wall biosynthesis
LCISESTKTDLIKFCNVDEEKLYTVLEAADNQKFKPDYFSRTGKNTRQVYSIPDKPYLFTLSTLEPRKNLINTIKAFDLLLDENPDIDCNLVIGGKNGWKSKELMQLRHKTNIIFTNFVDENDLPDLYREAEALCYVSYYEGFGLPPLEAMSCKTPVIYGNNSSMKELFEGYALPANPDDIEDIKEQMKKVLTDSDLKKELEEKGLERSFDFSWRKTAMETLKAYEKSILKKRTKNG